MTRLLLFLALMLPLTSMASRNIIFIVADDMRVDPQAITPNIDALASQSTHYTNAYTDATYCLPSRTTVMFGLSAGTHRVGLDSYYPNPNVPPHSDIYGNAAIKSLPEILRENGYTTAVTGKVFHSPEPLRWTVNGPTIPWTEILDFEHPSFLQTFLQNHPLPAGETHPDQVVADWASGFIANTEGPFFLAIGFFQPHLPWIAPQWAYDLYPSVEVNLPYVDDLDDESVQAIQEANFPVFQGGVTQYTFAEPYAQELTHAYLAALSHTDAMIGQVLAALDASGKAGDTDVILWSDHGYHLGEKYHWRKTTFWQQTVQVPLIIKSPAIAAGTVSTPVSLLDLAPTVADLAGLDPVQQFEGVSLRLGQSPVEVFHKNGKATIVGNMKNIDYDLAIPGRNDVAEYDLLSDPQELTNLTPPGC